MAKRNKGASWAGTAYRSRISWDHPRFRVGFSKTHNTMAKRQNTYNGCPLVSFGHFVVTSNDVLQLICYLLLIKTYNMKIKIEHRKL
jgi:hypothetical protein